MLPSPVHVHTGATLQFKVASEEHKHQISIARHSRTSTGNSGYAWTSSDQSAVQIHPIVGKGTALAAGTTQISLQNIPNAVSTVKVSQVDHGRVDAAEPIEIVTET